MVLIMPLLERSLTYIEGTLGHTVKYMLHLRYKYKGCSRQQGYERFGKDIRLRGKHPHREMCSCGHLAADHLETEKEGQIRAV
jgi:hypothetical protein